MKKLVLLLLSILPLIGYSEGASAKYEALLESMSSELSEDLLSMNIKRIAISTIFDHSGESNQFTYLLEEDLSVAILNRRKGLELMDRNHLVEVLAEHRLAAGGLMNEETVIQLGKLESVDAIITGSIIYIDGEFKINMKAMSTVSGMLISARRFSFTPNSAMKKMYEEKLSSQEEDISLNVKSGTVKLKNKGKKIEVILFYNNPKSEDAKKFNRRVVLARGEEIFLENIPLGNLQYNTFKHRNRSSVIRTLLRPDNTLKMGNIEVLSGQMREVRI